MSRRSERGSILVWTLAAVAVLAAVTTGIGRLAIGTQDATWRVTSRVQADALVRSGVVITALALEAHVNSGLPDVLGAFWAGPHRRRLGSGWVEIEVEDVARRIDLNTPELRPALARLARALELPATVVPAIADWVDADDAPRGRGAEARWYARRRPALVPTNAPLESVHHLGHLRGVTAAGLARLAPYVTVHGQPAVNPNTAPEMVLNAWLGDPTLVRRVLAERGARPTTCVGLRYCTQSSQRFVAHVRARIGVVERAADVTLLVPRGLPAKVEAWEPPALPWSDGSSDRRRSERRPQQP